MSSAKLSPRSALLLAPLIGCLLLGCGRAQVSEDDSPTCRDEDGNAVDWFIAYKFPMINGQEEPFQSGLGYAYVSSEQDIDPAWQAAEDGEKFLRNFRHLLQEHLGVPSKASAQSGWTIAKYPINHDNSMIMRSLALAFRQDRPNSLNWIFYNDHPAKPLNGNSTTGQSQTRAHAKGSLLINDESGDAMWLSHTVPRFPPPAEDPLVYGESAYKNAQTFVCLNYDARQEGNKVISHLANMFALIYNSNVSPKLRTMIPELEDLKLEGERSGLGKSDRLASLDQMLTTRGGQEFELFSKSSNLGGDLYASWLTQELDSSLYVETWRSGFGAPLDSDCPRDKHQVNNVKSLRLISNLKTLFSWPYTKDHSKWAISETQEDGVVCLADINRMASQFKRGGGAVCIRDPKVWTVFSNTIEELEPCKYKPKLVKKRSKLSSLRKRFVEKIKKLLAL